MREPYEQQQHSRAGMSAASARSPCSPSTALPACNFADTLSCAWQLGVERLGGSGAPGWAWAQPTGAAGVDDAISAHNVAAMVTNALRLEV